MLSDILTTRSTTLTDLEKLDALQPQMVAWRREFHRHPELGFREHWTSARVAEILTGLGCRVRTGVGRTGVVGEVGHGLPVIAIRADMDALPILESADRPYASETPGMMHACGHDSHITMLLGAAALLAGHPFITSQDTNGKPGGTVRFLFQPSEEVADSEGLSGAPRMITDGAMQDVELVIAAHVDPATPVGQIRLIAGPFSGGVDSFYATIYGKGSHGAWPHAGVDPIYIAGHVILGLHGIVSRRLDPFAPAVVSIGSVHGGQAENVIPDQVELSGTLRFLEKDVQKIIHTELKKALEISRALGGDYELEIEIGTPPMINDAAIVDRLCNAAGDLLGREHVLPPLDSLGAEDFGCFSEVAPGAMFSLGCQLKDDERLLHNPRFDIDERCLSVGAAIFVETTLRWLKERQVGGA
jgi:amidohydrolase